MNDQLNNILMECDRRHVFQPLVTTIRRKKHYTDNTYDHALLTELPDEFNELKAHLKTHYLEYEYADLTMSVSYSTNIYHTQLKNKLISARIKALYDIFQQHYDLERFSEDSVSKGFSDIKGKIATVKFFYRGCEIHKVDILTDITELVVHHPIHKQQHDKDMESFWKEKRG